MSKTILLRHVPTGLHQRLKARAALEGLPISDFLIRELRNLTELTTMEEIRTRLAAQAPVHMRTSPTRALRKQRGVW